MSKRSELVLAPGTFAYTLDRANARLSVLVGPVQNKLEEMEGAVIYDPTKRRVVGCPLDRAVQPIVVVPDGAYAEVTNPHVGDDGLPCTPPARKKTLVDDIELQYGRTINVRGPTALVPWPGQQIRVRDGYRLASDQYLVVEATDLMPDARDRMESIGWKSDDHRFVVLGSVVSHFIPPTGVRVLTKVETALRLGPLDWVRLDGDEGESRYVRRHMGDKEIRILYPSPYESIGQKGQAIDLRTCGVHYRQVEEDGSVTEHFVTECGKAGPPAYYWPADNHSLFTVSTPIEIPVGGGVYVKSKATGDISVYDKPGPFLPNPLEVELVKREGRTVPFAEAVVVQENQVAAIASATGGRYVVGPTVTLLQYHESVSELDGRLQVLSERSIPLQGVTADDVRVTSTLEVTQRLVGASDQWFSTDSGRFQIEGIVQRRFIEAVKKLTVEKLDTVDAKTLLGEADPLVLGDVEYSGGYLKPISLDDDELSELLYTNKRERSVEAALVAKRQLEVDRRQAAQAHAKAMADFERQLRELDDQKTRAVAEAEVQNERIKLEVEKARQELLDELTTYELDRETRRGEAKLAIQEKEQALHLALLAAQAGANEQVLAALQPELIAAIKAAGAQTSFSKVVQHLGPASILQGVGLEEAIRKLIGQDAASSLLMVDKPNGRTAAA